MNVYLILHFALRYKNTSKTTIHSCSRISKTIQIFITLYVCFPDLKRLFLKILLKLIANGKSDLALYQQQKKKKKDLAKLKTCRAGLCGAQQLIIVVGKRPYAQFLSFLCFVCFVSNFNYRGEGRNGNATSRYILLFFIF